MHRTGITGHFLARRIWNLVLDELFPENRPYCKLCRKPLPGDKMEGQKSNRKGFWTGGRTGNQIREQIEEQKFEGLLGSICPFCAQEAGQVKLVNLLKSVPLRHVNQLRQGRGASAKGAQGKTGRLDRKDRLSESSKPSRLNEQVRRLENLSSLPIVCALEYSGFVRTSIRHYKYDGLTELVPWFSSSMMEAAGARHIFEHVDGIVHVPTSVDRARKRGYDQAHLLASTIAKSARLPHFSVLGRRKDESTFTQSQTAKSKEDRIKSLQGKFVCAAHGHFQDKRILLVDDVVTTGATMQTCADLLLEAGARSVIGLVVAYVR